jgi:hypothetical protein
MNTDKMAKIEIRVFAIRIYLCLSAVKRALTILGMSTSTTKDEQDEHR